MSRRRALQLIGVGIGTAGGLVAFAGCDKKDGGAAGGDKVTTKGGTCQEKEPGDDNAKQLRKNLQYKEKADTADKKCNLCVQYEAGKYGDCGGCKLFGGAVNPEGVCLSFAPKNAAPGGPPGVATPPGVAPPASPPGVAPAAPSKG